jgi:DNA-binding NarL/FixJ family response regulator
MRAKADGPAVARTTVFVAIADDRLRSNATTIVDGAPDLDLAGVASTGAEATEMIADAVPDLALVDIDLPGTDGLGVCAAISERFPVVRLVLVSAADDERCYLGVAAGAVGCVFSSEVSDHLLAVMRRVSWGEAVITKGWATRMLAEIAALTADPDAAPVAPPTLTPTEREVLRRIAGGATPDAVADLHQVPTRLVNLHAGFAIGKLRRWHRDVREVESLR